MQRPTMADLIHKAGGRFRLTVLVQKRMIQLNRGARCLVESEPDMDPIDIVYQEIIQDRIWLSGEDNAPSEIEMISRDFLADDDE